MSVETVEGAPTDVSVKALLLGLRDAQQHWAATPIRKRLRCIREFRRRVCEHAEQLAKFAAVGRSEAEVVTSEILPLCDAARFLERSAEAILRNKKMSTRARPIWLTGVKGEILREPFGVILIVGAINYPIFLAGIQMLQGLAAGNAVVLKPAPGTKKIIGELIALAEASGIEGVIANLDESVESVSLAVEAGVDKIFLTGGSEAGRAVMHAAAEKAIPTVMELSGCDSLVVLPSADVKQAAAALRFGLALNRGRTCIRPARLIVHASVVEEFNQCLETELRSVRWRPSSDEHRSVQPLLESARDTDGELIGDPDYLPFVACSRVAHNKHCGSSEMLPVACEVIFESIDECLRLAHHSRVRLGASIFGEQRAAGELAKALDVGTVVINDVIVPTADPRASFTGRGASGFGSTRGEEGLLEMTRPKAVMTRRGKCMHFAPESDSDRDMFMGALRAIHGRTLSMKLHGAVKSLKAAMRRES